MASPLLDKTLDDVFGAPAGKESDVERIVGEAFGPSDAVPPAAEQLGVQEIAPGSLRDPFARADVVRARNSAEAAAAFYEHFPNGRLLVAGEEGTVTRLRPETAGRPEAFGEAEALTTEKVINPVYFFQEDPSQPIRRVDDLGFGGSAREAILDLTVDLLAPDFGAIVFELLATLPQTKYLKVLPLLSRFRFANKAIPLPARVGVGAAVGETVQEATEEVRGISRESVGEQATAVGTQAALAAGGEKILGGAASRVVRAGTGRGLLNVRRGAEEAQAAARRLLGKKLLPVNLVAQHPIVQKLGGQASAITPRIETYIEGLEQTLAAATQKTRDALKKAAPTTSKGIALLDQQLRRQANDVRDLAMRHAGRTKRSLSDTASAFSQALVRQDADAVAKINRSYEAARAIEEPEFNFSGLRAAADDSKKGVQARTPDRVSPESVDTPTIIPGENIRLNEVSSEVDSVTSDILRLSENPQPVTVTLNDGTQRVVSVTDQLRALRQRLFDAKTPIPGDIARQPQKEAGRLFGVITEMMRNPTNSNKQFAKMWRGADRLASTRFGLHESVVMTEAARALRDDGKGSVEGLVSRLGDLSNPDRIQDFKILRRVLPSAEFSKLQDGIATEMIRRPDQIAAKLDAAQPEVLRQVFSPKDIAALRTTAKAFDRMAKVGIKGLAEKQGNIGRHIIELGSSGNKAAIDQIQTAIRRRGGKLGAIGTTARAGIIDEIVTRSLVFEKGGSRFDFIKATSVIDGLKQSGAFQILTRKEREFFDDATRIQDFLRLLPDAGTSIQAASLAADVRGIAVGRSPIKGLLRLAENLTVGRLFASPVGIRLLTGFGRKKKAITRSDRIAALAAATAQIVTGNPVERAQDVEDFANMVAGFASGAGAIAGRFIDEVTSAQQPNAP